MIGMIELTNENFTKEVFDKRYHRKAANKELPCIVYFYADWCGPCKMIDPILRVLAEEYKGVIKFFSANIDELEAKSSSYFNVRSIPALIFIGMQGRDYHALLGVQSKATIERNIKSHLLDRD